MLEASDDGVEFVTKKCEPEKEVVEVEEGTDNNVGGNNNEG